MLSAGCGWFNIQAIIADKGHNVVVAVKSVFAEHFAVPYCASISGLVSYKLNKGNI